MIFKTAKERKQSGFTLIELMIVVAILGILAAIAIPTYVDYTRKARYSEIVVAAAPWKLGVSECISNEVNTSGGGLTACDAGTNGVPADATNTGNGLISSIATTNTDTTVIITLTPNATKGIEASDTLIMTATFNTSTDQITWSNSGGAVTKGYVKASP